MLSSHLAALAVEEGGNQPAALVINAFGIPLDALVACLVVLCARAQQKVENGREGEARMRESTKQEEDDASDDSDDEEDN